MIPKSARLSLSRSRSNLPFFEPDQLVQMEVQQQSEITGPNNVPGSPPFMAGTVINH